MARKIWDWFKKWFSVPHKCGICEGQLDPEYGKICYRSYHADTYTIEHMYVCSVCLDLLEEKHKTFSRAIESWKQQNLDD